jgi:hypothetical protein
VPLAVLTFSAAASGQPTPDGRPVQQRPQAERCCLADDWSDRCASLLPRVHEEAYGPYLLGTVTVQARVRCRTETILPDAAQKHVREMLSLEFVDPAGGVLYRREFRGERGYPIFRQARIAIGRGDRDSGILLQETRTPDPDDGLDGPAVSTLALLVHRQVVSSPSDRRYGSSMASWSRSRFRCSARARGDHVEVVVEATRTARSPSTGGEDSGFPS